MSGVSASNKRIAKNSLFLYVRMVIVLFVSIYTTRVVLSALGVEDFGIYNVVCGFVAMFSFLNTSMSNGIQRFYNYEAGFGDKMNVTKVYQTSLLIQFLLAVLLVIVLETIGVWYVNNKMVLDVERLVAANWVFQFSVASLILLVLQIPYSALILAHERMDYYAVVSIIDVFLKLAIVFVLPYISSDKLIFYGLLQLAVAIINFLLYFIYAKRHFKELYFECIFHYKLFKSIFVFSGWNVTSMFAWMTQSQGVNMVINLFFGPIVNAARGVSGQIQAAIQGFCENLVVAFRPQLVQSYAKGDIQKTKKMMYSMSKILFVMFYLLSTPVIFEIDYILHLWLGENVPNYTASFTILILLSMYPRNFSMAFAQVVHATGKLGLYQVVSSIIILLALPLSYMALDAGANVLFVFWINIGVCVLMYIVCMFVLKRLFPIDLKEYLHVVLYPCIFMGVISLIVPMIITTVMPKSILRFIIDLIVTTFVSILMSYKIILNVEERAMLKKIILKK